MEPRGKIVAAITFAAVVLGAAYVPIRDYLASRGKLNVVASMNQFSIPPGLDSAMKDSMSYPWGDVLPGTYFEITASNVGNRELRSVYLFSPRALYWCRRIGEAEPHCLTQRDSLVLGTLPAGRTALVQLWSSASDSIGDARLLRAYADGEPVPVRLRGSDYPRDRHGFLWIVAIVGVAALLLFLLIQWHGSQIDRATLWQNIYTLRDYRVGFSRMLGQNQRSMNSPDLPQIPTDAEVDLRGHLDRLASVLTTYKARDEHFLGDHIVFAYAQQVRECSEGAILLCRSDIPHSAWSVARAAFEAAQDLAYLSSRQEEFDKRAALARTIELVEEEDVRRRFTDADIAAGYGANRLFTTLTPEQVVKEDAVFIEESNAAAARLLRESIIEARTKGRAKKHWSGFSRKRLGEQIAIEHPEIAIVDKVGDCFYGVASMHSHPRILYAYRGAETQPDNSIMLRSPDADKTLPMDLSKAAVVLALQGLEWIGYAVPPAED